MKKTQTFSRKKSKNKTYLLLKFLHFFCHPPQLKKTTKFLTFNKAPTFFLKYRLRRNPFHHFIINFHRNIIDGPIFFAKTWYLNHKKNKKCKISETNNLIPFVLFPLIIKTCKLYMNITYWFSLFPNVLLRL